MEALLGSWPLTAGLALLTWMFIKLYWSKRPRVKDLHQKAVLITGCDSGFGHELAKRLDAHGVKVYAGVLFPEGDGATTLKEVCSNRLHILHLDVTKDDHVSEAVKTVTGTLGDRKLWAVVNNAGIATYSGFEWTPMETMRKIMDVNTFGPIRVTTAFLPLLKESRGRVVIVASIAGHISAPGLYAYSMSKHAVVAFGDTIRRELWNWSVSVHLIKPYLYRTNISNPVFLIKEITKNWETSNILKSSYPSNYVDYVKKLMPIGQLAGKPVETIYEVLNDVEDAVLGSHPKVSYYPGFMGKVALLISIFCPPTILDFVSSLLQPPTKEGDRNRVLDFLHAALIKDEKELS